MNVTRMDDRDRAVVLTENERAWLEFLRLIGDGTDPRVTLRRVQLLRRVCEPRRA